MALGCCLLLLMPLLPLQVQSLHVTHRNCRLVKEASSMASVPMACLFQRKGQVSRVKRSKDPTQKQRPAAA